MKLNPTVPAVLESACAALSNIAANSKNDVMAGAAMTGAAGAVQVHVLASSYPTKITCTTLHLTHLPLVLHLPLPILLHPSLPMVLHHLSL